MKKFIISVFLIFLSVPSDAQFANIRYLNNNAWVAGQGDPDGTGYTTERYPRETKVSDLLLANGLTLVTGATGLTGATTTGFPTSSINALKLLRIQATGWTTCGGSVVFQLVGSYDGITYAPVYSQDFSSGRDSTSLALVPARTDTMQIILSGIRAQTIASPGAWFKFDKSDLGIPLVLPYYAVKVINRLFGSGSATVTYTIEAYGRQF